MASVVPIPSNAPNIGAVELANLPHDEVIIPDPVSAIQRVGRALQHVLDSSTITLGCRTALNRMANVGEILEMRFVEEIRHNKLLETFVNANHGSGQVLASFQMIELREAIAACVTATLTEVPVVELMSLWSVVHESINDLTIERAQAALTEVIDNGRVALESVEDVSDNIREVGMILSAALTTSTALSSSISNDLREAIRKLSESGTPLMGNLIEELRSHLSAIQQALPEQTWTELSVRLSGSVVSEWKALGEAAKKLNDQRTKGLETVVKVFDSPLGKAIAVQGLAGFDGVLGQSRDAVDSALDAIRSGSYAVAGSCLTHFGLPPLLRLEIVRDFFQAVGLFYSGLYSLALDYLVKHHIASDMHRFLSGIRGVYDMVSVNIVAVVNLLSMDREKAFDVAVAVMFGIIYIIYISFLWFAFSGRHLHRRTDEIRQGHEGTTWAALAAKQKFTVKMFTLIITACLTIYLPLTRLCLSVVVEAATNRFGNLDDVSGSSGSNGSSGYYYSGSGTSTSFSNMNNVDNFNNSRILRVLRSFNISDNSSTISTSELVVARYKDDSVWPFLVAACAIFLATFALPLPYLLVKAIAENRPTGSLENSQVTYDLDGEEVPFDNKVYARLVANDPSQIRCPYRSLYNGFEQRWSYYKVLQLVVKLALVLVIVLTSSEDTRVRGIISCGIYATVVVLSSYSTPFSDPLNNIMEISSKLTALITCVGGVLAAFVDMDQSPSRALEAVTVFVSIANIVNLFVMFSVLLLGMRGARLFVKNVLGWITFSDTSRGLEDAPAKNILPLWDLEKEVKHRVWQAFWRSVLLEVAQQNNISKGDVEETVVHRLNTLEQAIVASGIRRVRSHWRGEDNSYVASIRQMTRVALEGVDVYWDDVAGARDGSLDSKSCFGKMYVVPYPFHCVIVYDDSKDETIIRDEVDKTSGQSKLSKLLFLNFSPNIVAKRGLRSKLRVLSDQGSSITFPFSRQEQATVQDGTITTTDANGVTRTQPRFSTVTFTCYYTRGVIKVATKGDATKRIMAEGFNVSMTYRDGYGDATAPYTGQVHHLKNRVAVMGPSHIGLNSTMEESDELRTIFTQTQAIWEAGVPELHTQHQEYRRGLKLKYQLANATLSDGFWYFVYNNPHLSREELENHLKCREHNPRLKSLPETHQTPLDSLYLRLKFIQSHPAATLWFTFWDDVYARNGEMRRLRKFRREFDPREPGSICYQVMRRPELETWLRERRLLGGSRLFHSRLLDLLYFEMEKRMINTNK